MFSSLRARLWLSYALLLFVALVFSSIILIFYLPRSPLFYRQTYARFEAIQTMLLASHPELTSLPAIHALPILQDMGEIYQVRILIYDPDQKLIIDSRAGSTTPLILSRRALLARSNLIIRDETGRSWLFYISKQADGKLLLVGEVRPRIVFLAILTSEIIPPFLVAGLLALILALIVAYGLARWIANPLQTIVLASRRVPVEDSPALPLHGPREIQELTRAFNAMLGRVQATQRSQREFIANVSHELKTPLTAIQGFAQALQDGTADTEAARLQAAGVIQDEAERMNRMVIDLLDLARLDAGTLVLHKSQVDLPFLLAKIIRKFTPQAHKAGVIINLVSENDASLVGDGDRLAQVFTNLVDNALKYTLTGGRIDLLVRPVNSPFPAVEVNVTDNGPGIPLGSLPNIFNRFYQADPSRPGGKKHGAGLGLAIVKEIVAAHDGTITVRSEPGNGSTFTVTLPRTAPDAHPGLSRFKK